MIPECESRGYFVLVFGIRIVVVVLVAGENQHGLAGIQSRNGTLKIINQIITGFGFYQKTTVVDIGYIHTLPSPLSTV